MQHFRTEEKDPKKGRKSYTEDNEAWVYHAYINRPKLCHRIVREDFIYHIHSLYFLPAEVNAEDSMDIIIIGCAI